ncbi:MAG: hypothetical protein JXB42_09305 [Deltaproteobacteria bacterium]|nr:hypothetical protein [Deltaproteobacteria bacterium]
MPIQGWIGITLVVIFWALNWSVDGLRTHWGFFPLWLGYCLTVDAFVYVRKGTSLLTRSPGAYAGLFIISIPSWWLFELINGYTQNWHYEGRQFFTDFEYFLLSSISFSTVMPAVFGTAELVGTFKWIDAFKSGTEIKPRAALILTIFVAGLFMFYLLLSWPLYFFPFVWVSVFLILEPINVWLKNRTLFQYTAEGNWGPVISLCTGCLICGFFWEMWNFYSYPKWVYSVPFVDFLHVFEMPLLGYGGYLPFSLELFALYHLIIGLCKRHNTRDFIQI